MARSATRSPSDWRDWKAAKAIIMKSSGAMIAKRICVILAIWSASRMQIAAPMIVASASDQTIV